MKDAKSKESEIINMGGDPDKDPRMLISKSDEEHLFENLTKMSLVVRNLNPVKEDATHHVMVEIFREFWPLIEYMLQRYKSEPRYMEKVCKIVKYTMRCIKHLFYEFISNYFSIIVKNYQEYPLPAYLYTIEIALTIFYRDENLKQWLSDIFTTMVNRTTKELKILDDFEENPELAEDFYGFLFRYVRYALRVILECECLELILDNTLIGIGCTQTEAAKMLYSFIQELFRASQPDKLKRLECTPAELQDLCQKSKRLEGLLLNKYGTLIVKAMLESLPKDMPVGQF